MSIKSVIGNFMKHLCTVLFQWLFLDQISFETKQKSKHKVDFKFFFISIEKKIYFGNILNYFEKIREPIKFYSTLAIIYNFIAP